MGWAKKNKQLSDVVVTTILIETGGDSRYQRKFGRNIKFKDRESCLLIETFDESLSKLDDENGNGK